MHEVCPKQRNGHGWTVTAYLSVHVSTSAKPICYQGTTIQAYLAAHLPSFPNRFTDTIPIAPEARSGFVHRTFSSPGRLQNLASTQILPAPPMKTYTMKNKKTIFIYVFLEVIT